jgi:hypothetical protein
VISRQPHNPGVTQPRSCARTRPPQRSRSTSTSLGLKDELTLPHLPNSAPAVPVEDLAGLVLYGSAQSASNPLVGLQASLEVPLVNVARICQWRRRPGRPGSIAIDRTGPWGCRYATGTPCVGVQMTRPTLGKQGPEPNRSCSSMVSRSPKVDCRMGHTRCMSTPMTRSQRPADGVAGSHASTGAEPSRPGISIRCARSPARGRKLVWHHRDSGETQIWFMDGHQLVRRGTVLGEDGNPAFVGLPFEIVGVGEGEMRHRARPRRPCVAIGRPS